MANTILTDLDFVPETFAQYVEGEVYKRSNFLSSGAVVDAGILLPRFGNTVTLPAFDALSGADEVKGTSAPSTNNVDGSAQVAPILNRVKKYGSTDLVSYFTGADPFGAIGNKFAQYWAQRMDEVAVASAIGCAAGIGATAMLNISAAAGADGVIDADAIIDAQALMGEFADELAFIVMHSKTLAVLRKQNLVTDIPNSEGTRTFPFYGDLRVVVSDTAGMADSATVYNTLMVGRGAFGYADGTNPLHVLEMDRDIGFADAVASSRRYVMHPIGGKFVATPAASSASNAELIASASWELGVPSVNGFKIRVLKHKISP